MTHSQYIEVAENIWGWKFQSHEPIEGTDSLIRIDVNEWVGLTGLRNDVNSWIGFGRTVEAMADKLNRVSIHDYRKFVKSVISAITESMWSRPFHFKHLIEATHLAALEAMKVVK